MKKKANIEKMNDLDFKKDESPNKKQVNWHKLTREEPRKPQVKGFQKEYQKIKIRGHKWEEWDD